MQTLTVIHMIYLGTLLILAIISMSMYKKVSPTYHPMLIFIMVSFLLETLQFFLSSYDTYNILLNVQRIADCLLIFWQAKRWGAFTAKPKLHYIILALLFAIWLSDHIPGMPASGKISVFDVVNSLAITFLAVNLLTKQILNVKGELLRSAIAVFSIGLIFYYLLNALLGIFSIIAGPLSQEMMRMIYIFFITVCFITNFIYLRSILCISNKPAY